MFEIGDRVRVISDSYSYINKGWTGIVRYVDDYDGDCSVEFDNVLENGHNCGGRLDSLNGYYIEFEDLEVIKRKHNNIEGWK